MTTTSSIPWADAQRQNLFTQWLASLVKPYNLLPETLAPASADASFRRYFRVRSESGTFIIMDAPPTQENNAAFVRMASLLRDGGLHVPHVLEWQQDAGFLLLTDLGDVPYQKALDLQSPWSPVNKKLYTDALDALVQLQQIAVTDEIPRFDAAFVRRELDLFPTWYIERHQNIVLDDQQTQTLHRAFDLISQVVLNQSQVLMHRDFHCRNLMVTAPNPGILDFQDAVQGPITYDLVSLVRDAYVEWDEEVQIDYAARYWERARQASLPVPDDFGVFWRDMEWTGLQRHLKILGIFARLYHRDGKEAYLPQIPTVWRYAHRVCMRYNALGPLALILERVQGVDRYTGHTF